ncbi:glycosyl hydrolase [Polycladomyces sp. WAk]|uniref:Glycosyl hydrolase n=1 Tax=Polycladomyces zharkentensis TaxID=2807616 RepID=A0ABS2WEX6_9BACL|nr:glycosyl hydrolase [Polycladomyces sp. WAk]MBN2908087.1 glycosyl hydrolase [Polycladomyces sp. WAk]
MRRLFLCMERELVIWDGKKVQYHFQGMQPTSIASDPFHPGRLYCGTFGRGLWLSDDDGDSWRPTGDIGNYFEPFRGEGIHHAAITAVAVSPTQKSGDYGVVYAGTEPSALFYSTDGGKTWNEYKEIRLLPSTPTWAFPPRPHTSHIRWITPDPNQKNRMFVSIEAGAVIRTLDNGETWEDKKFGGPLDAHTLLMHPRAADRLYAACGDGVRTPGRGYMESRDGGNTWTAAGEGLEHHYLYGMAVDARDPDVVLVSASPGPFEAHHSHRPISYIYRKEGDSPWERVSDGLPPAEGTIISMLDATQQEPHEFYALNNKGVYRSVDRGKTWSRVEIPWKEEYLRQHPHAILVLE